MRRIAVTGANSFVGRAFVSAMAPFYQEILLVTRAGHGAMDAPPNSRLVELSMEEYRRLGSLTGPVDCLVCLAWSGTRGGARMDRALQRRNLEYSLAGIRSVLDTGCGRIVLAGSQAEYGPHREQISEESFCRPNTEYGQAKLELYQQAKSLCREKDAVLVEPRFFSLYGPGDFQGTMVSSMLRAMCSGSPCRLTQCTQLWDFLYITDAAQALARLCEDSSPGGVYNLGSGDCRPLREYVLEMAEITATTSQLQFGAIPYPETGMVSIWPDISRLRGLGWEPQVSFAEGIRAILEKMRPSGGL